jgi:hypothetical protein
MLPPGPKSKPSRKRRQAELLLRGSYVAYSYALKMQAVCSSETSCTARSTWRYNPKDRALRIISGWCIRSCGFCLTRLFPNKNCMLAMCNTPFCNFRFPLSNIFGIFPFELMVRNFRTKTMECLVEKNEHFRHLLLYEFNRGSKAAEAT